MGQLYDCGSKVFQVIDDKKYGHQYNIELSDCLYRLDSQVEVNVVEIE